MASFQSRPRLVGEAVGVYTTNVGAAWVDLTGADFTSVSVYAPAATHVFATLSIQNTHGSNTLYLLLRANDGEATSAAIPIAAGATQALDLYGANVTAISLQGSGANTTHVTIATFSKP